MFKQAWQGFIMWIGSTQVAYCDCIRWDFFGGLRCRRSTLIRIDMSDITVTEPTAIQCDMCGCEFVLSKHGVLKA